MLINLCVVNVLLYLGSWIKKKDRGKSLVIQLLRLWARGCIFVGRCDCGVWMDCGLSLYVIGVVRGGSSIK